MKRVSIFRASFNIPTTVNHAGCYNVNTMSPMTVTNTFCSFVIKLQITAANVVTEVIPSLSFVQFPISYYGFQFLSDSSQWHWNEFESGGGHTSSTKCQKKNFCCAPPLFLALQLQLVVLMSALVMVSTSWSVSCLLFFYSRCPPCPMESAPMTATCFVIISHVVTKQYKTGPSIGICSLQGKGTYRPPMKSH